MGLALAGAPVGAGIAVFGVWLTNKHAYKTHRELLTSQETQQRQQLEFDLKAGHLQQTLAKRSDIYEQLLRLADDAAFMAAWASGNERPDNVPPLVNEDLVDIKQSVPPLRYRVDVHCSSDVRHEMSRFADAIENVDETSESAVWGTLTQ